MTSPGSLHHLKENNAVNPRRGSRRPQGRLTDDHSPGHLPLAAGGASLGFCLDANKKRERPKTCRECGAAFKARRASAEFCSKTCRADFHNRRARQGADLFDVLMAWRFDRANAKGLLTLLCRMASAFKADEKRDRDGRPSWNNADRLKMHHVHFRATVVARDIAGCPGRGRRS
jgi:hypothetical protein